MPIKRNLQKSAVKRKETHQQKTSNRRNEGPAEIATLRMEIDTVMELTSRFIYDEFRRNERMTGSEVICMFHVIFSLCYIRMAEIIKERNRR